MVVILIIAIASAGVVVGFRAVNRSELKSACMKIVAASRFSYSRAITKGTTVRILLDVDSDTLTLQEAHGRVTLARLDDPRRAEEGDSDEAAVDPWRAARERLEKTLQPSFGASPFGPIHGRDGEVLERTVTQEVGSGIDIVRVITPHEPGPRENGRGSIYYFSGGQSEHAVVHLSAGGDEVYTVEIHGLTGRGRVHSSLYEPDIVREEGDDEDRSEVEDPG